MSGGLWPLIGLVIGILAAIALTVLIYRGGAIRMNLSVFFTYTGLFLIVVAAGILTYGIRALQTIGWLPGLDNIAFDVSGTYDASSWYGTVLGGIFNVRPDPTVLQVIAWMVYVVVVTTIFFRRQRAGHRAIAARKSATADESSAPAEPTPRKECSVNRRTVVAAGAAAVVIAPILLAGCTEKSDARMRSP